MNYWIFKIGDQKTYPDITGHTYVYDNTHSVRVQTGDKFIYLSTKNNRYEFTGHGVVNNVTAHHPDAAQKRNDRVKTVYTAHLIDVATFSEPLDFLPSSPAGRLHRKAVGVESALAWGISMPKLDPATFQRLTDLAQPTTINAGSPVARSTHPNGAPAKRWTTPTEATQQTLAQQEQNAIIGQDYEPNSFSDARERVARSLVLRRGQPDFRKKLITAYAGRCAVTGCDVVDALEAAHIYPYRGDHTNQITNGLLLRSDVHALFDLGLVTVDTKDMTIILKPSLLYSTYAELRRARLALPKQSALRPSAVLLDWHRTWWQTEW